MTFLLGSSPFGIFVLFGICFCLFGFRDASFLVFFVWSVGPKFLQSVELTVLCQENVGDDVSVVQNDPEIVFHTLGTKWLSAFLAHLADDVVGYRVDICRGIGVADHKVVSDRGSQRPEVYVNDILSFLVEHSVGHDPQIVSNHIENVLYFCITIQIYKYTTNSEPMKEEVDIQWLLEVDSTNNEVIRHLADLDNLSVVAAVRQTAGRGQRGNSWLAEAGKNMTFSIVLKFGEGHFPLLEASRQFVITRCVTLGVADYLESMGIDCAVKWPNDIYVRNKKICGMLIENTLRGTYIATSVIGIGLNVNQKEFPPQLVNPASMTMLTGKEYDIHAELPVLCGFIRDRLTNYDNADEYAARLYRFGTLNEYVVCRTGEAVRAMIVDVTDRGMLCLETEKGERLEFAFKEISYII